MVQQTILDIPQVDTKATRKAVYAYFALYRRYKQQLADGWDTTKRDALAGYENTVDPDLIRKPGFSGGGFGPRMTEEERKAAKVDWVDRKVDRLPPYGREIIRRRFLAPIKGHQSIHDLPTDTAVLEGMKRDGWYGEQRYYEEQKAEAVQMMAEMLRLVIYK